MSRLGTPAPVCHACRLGELRGLALCLPWRHITGLQPEQVGGQAAAGGTF